MTRDEFEEALTPTLLESLRAQVMRLGNGLADDAVQNALEDFPYKDFDPAGTASLFTFLTKRVKQRAYNLLDQSRRFYSCSFQDSDETGVPPYDLWEDVNKDTGETYLKADFQETMGWDSGDEESDNSSAVGEAAWSDDKEVDENEQDDDFYNAEMPFDIMPATEISADTDPVLVDMVRAEVEQSRYHDAHPWALRECFKDKPPLLAAECEELVSLDANRLLQDLFLQHQQDMAGKEMTWYSRLPHTEIIRHLKAHYPEPHSPHPHGLKVRPPGEGNGFCDRLHHHKYGYLPLRLLSCEVCLPVNEVRAELLPEGGLRDLHFTDIPSDPPLGLPDTPSRSQGTCRKVRIWSTEQRADRVLEYGYAETQVRRFHPSLNPDCLTAWELIRDFLYGSSDLRLHGIVGRTKQPMQRTSDRNPLETWTDMPWIGGDPITHALYSRYLGYLKTKSRALLWLADENFGQEYMQEEIAGDCDLSMSTGMAAEQVNDPYAQALAQCFRGVGRSTISRRYDEIQQWFRRLQSEPCLFTSWRPPSPPTDFLVPADESCRYCGGLLLKVWVDPLRARLLPGVPAGTDAAYPAKRCVNCGDHIDSLTLRRRGKAYDNRADAFLRDTYTSEEIRDLVKHYGKHSPVVFRKLSRQYTTPLSLDSKLPSKP